MRILLASGSPVLPIFMQRALARFKYKWTVVDNGFDAFQKAITTKFDLILLDYDLPRMKAPEVLKRCSSIENFKRPPVVVLTMSDPERRSIEFEHFPRTTVISRPVDIRKFVSTVQQILHQNVQVACLGGGTGLFTLLTGLKTLTGISLASVVSMSDDGGSTGRLRHMFGILPPGDVRRSLVALSTAPDLVNELMQYRFEKGEGLAGHSVGNILLTALTQMRGSMVHAVKSIGEILNIQGEVIPVTEMINTLHAELENGDVIVGEKNISDYEDRDPKLRIQQVWQEPAAAANPDAIEALFNAKFILLGPGDLFTSIISNLIVGGISEAIVSSRAVKIYVANVMTKPGETHQFQVSDHVCEIVKHLQKDVLDYVIASSTQFSKEALQTYAAKNQIPVVEKDPRRLKSVSRAKFIFSDVASDVELLRHDSLKLAAEIKKIIDAHLRKN